MWQRASHRGERPFLYTRKLSTCAGFALSCPKALTTHTLKVFGRKDPITWGFWATLSLGVEDAAHCQQLEVSL